MKSEQELQGKIKNVWENWKIEKKKKKSVTLINNMCSQTEVYGNKINYKHKISLMASCEISG